MATIVSPVSVAKVRSCHDEINDSDSDSLLDGDRRVGVLGLGVRLRRPCGGCGGKRKDGLNHASDHRMAF